MIVMYARNAITLGGTVEAAGQVLHVLVVRICLSDALSVRSGQSVEIVFRRGREDILHTLHVVAAKKLLHLCAFAAQGFLVRPIKLRSGRWADNKILFDFLERFSSFLLRTFWPSAYAI